MFLLAPLQIATGAAMSPSIIARFPRYTRLFGGKQAARTLHFLGLCAFAAFVVVHTVMVLLHGLGDEFTYIVLASDPLHASPNTALLVGLVGLVGVVAINVLATVLSLRHRRRLQRLTDRLVDPLERMLSRTLSSRQRYTRTDISPYHRVNGYPPPDPGYRRLAEQTFAGYRLEVSGLVEQPVSLSLGDLRALGATSQITKHNCIQGWTNIAEWGGVPLAALLDQCRPTPDARYVVFYAFDDKTITENEGRFGHFYGTIPLGLARRPQTILALEMTARRSRSNTAPRSVSGSRRSSASKWSSGSGRSSWSTATRRSVWARAAGARTSSTTPTPPASNPRSRAMPTPPTPKSSSSPAPRAASVGRSRTPSPTRRPARAARPRPARAGGRRRGGPLARRPSTRRPHRRDRPRAGRGRRRRRRGTLRSD
jgi:DMSO/TMAO reductase YedYZ molybdopterin-dependent catalytic subunit